MNSGLFKLNLKDLGKGAFSAVIAAFIFSLAGVAGQAGFDVFSADWGAILSTALNAGIASFIGYIGKNFLSDGEGNVLGFGSKK